MPRVFKGAPFSCVSIQRLTWIDSTTHLPADIFECMILVRQVLAVQVGFLLLGKLKERAAVFAFVLENVLGEVRIHLAAVHAPVLLHLFVFGDLHPQVQLGLGGARDHLCE